MGCDIHSVIQVYDEYEKKWNTVEKRVNGDPRNYDYFAILANVRNGSGFAGISTGQGFIPISDPKGLPEDFEVQDVNQHQGLWMGDHSHSHLTLDDILYCDTNQVTMKTGVVNYKEYMEWRKQPPGTSPQSYCADVGGGKAVILSQREAEGLLADKETLQDHQYVRVSWQITYGQVSSFAELVERLKVIKDNFHADDEHIRIVFGFDS